jgi:hypothetical protein
MKKIKIFRFDEFTDSVTKAAETFCYRGYRVLTFCPICLKPLLSVEEARALMAAFASPQNSRLVESFTTAYNIGLLILTPSNIETARLLNFKLILTPLCSHHTGIDAETIEHNIMVVSRFGEIVKDDSNISDKGK